MLVPCVLELVLEGPITLNRFIVQGFVQVPTHFHPLEAPPFSRKNVFKRYRPSFNGLNGGLCPLPNSTPMTSFYRRKRSPFWRLDWTRSTEFEKLESTGLRYEPQTGKLALSWLFGKHTT